MDVRRLRLSIIFGDAAGVPASHKLLTRDTNGAPRIVIESDYMLQHRSSEHGFTQLLHKNLAVLLRFCRNPCGISCRLINPLSWSQGRGFDLRVTFVAIPLKLLNRPGWDADKSRKVRKTDDLLRCFTLC